MTYDINQLALITCLTTRTLRNYIASGDLEGEKTDGVWRFTDEQISAFISKPAVRQSMAAKRNAVVYDFLADDRKKNSSVCLILDVPANGDEAREISEYFCAAVNAAQDSGTHCGTEMRFCCEHGNARVILSGPEDIVAGIMKGWYRA